MTGIFVKGKKVQTEVMKLLEVEKVDDIPVARGKADLMLDLGVIDDGIHRTVRNHLAAVSLAARRAVDN
jgi:hypothetical protein